MRAATVVQQVCKSCRTCFKFYCMFYFTCDRSFIVLCRCIGHFLLTYLLLERLVSSAPSRIVTLSSKGHKYGKLDLDDVQLKRRWSALSAYCRSKTANILFTTHLARLLQGAPR